MCSSFLLHFINDRYDPFCFDSCRMKRFDASYACMIPVHILICTEEEGAQGHVDEVHLWHPLIDESWGLMDRGWCYGMKIWKRKRRSEKVMNSWSFHGRRWDKIGGRGRTRKDGNGNRIAKICTSFFHTKNIEILFTKSIQSHLFFFFFFFFK